MTTKTDTRTDTCNPCRRTACSCKADATATPVNRDCCCGAECRCGERCRCPGGCGC